jgi:hypothetical protein
VAGGWWLVAGGWWRRDERHAHDCARAPPGNRGVSGAAAVAARLSPAQALQDD